MDFSWPMRSHISSVMCGATGLSRMSSVSSSARVTLPLAYMALTRDIIAAMAVLNFMLS